MTPAITLVRLTGSADRAELPLLVLGPSLGTSSATLWTACARSGLTERFDVVAWDLPGHGHNHAVPDESFTMAELAQGLLHVIDDLQEHRGDLGEPFHYAGDSVGGCVGLQLMLDFPGRVTSAALLCTGARIGEPAMWAGRIGQVSVSGTPVMVAGSAERWFGPGFLDRAPDVGSALLHSLQDTEDRGYIQVCEALAAFDVRERLGQITAPVLAVAGAHDTVATVDVMAEVADGVKDGQLVVLDDVAHLAPAEQPEEVARLLVAHFLGDRALPRVPEEGRQGLSRRARGEKYDAGMDVRRAVLGDAHVDRAIAGTTPLTADFQELITEYAWGEIWTRPGLDRRSRSMITMTALIALGHDEELAMHVRAARTNGLTDDEIKEVILQSAIYCGVPAANTAFRIAQQVLEEEDES